MVFLGSADRSPPLRSWITRRSNAPVYLPFSCRKLNSDGIIINEKWLAFGRVALGSTLAPTDSFVESKGLHTAFFSVSSNCAPVGVGLSSARYPRFVLTFTPGRLTDTFNL